MSEKKPDKPCEPGQSKAGWCHARDCAHPQECQVLAQERVSSKRLSGNSGSIDEYLNEVTGGSVGND